MNNSCFSKDEIKEEKCSSDDIFGQYSFSEDESFNFQGKHPEEEDFKNYISTFLNPCVGGCGIKSRNSSSKSDDVDIDCHVENREERKGEGEIIIDIPKFYSLPETSAIGFSTKKMEKGNIILKNKTKRIEEIKKIKEIKENQKKEEIIDKLKRGRKPKDSVEPRKHSKNNEDNMILKIKTFLSNEIISYINRNFEDKTLGFEKIDSLLNESIKADLNKNMIGSSIEDLFCKYNTSSKCSVKGESYNKDLVEKIKHENKEKKVIKLLQIKYQSYLNFFRGIETSNDELLSQFAKIDKFIEKIKSKVDDIQYIYRIKELIFRFEKWFEDKKPRKRESKKNI